MGNAQKPYGGGLAASLDELSKAWAIYLTDVVRSKSICPVPRFERLRHSACREILAVPN
jgi:hypothetical protein